MSTNVHRETSNFEKQFLSKKKCKRNIQNLKKLEKYIC